MSVKVAFETSQGLLKQALNKKIDLLRDIFPEYTEYLDSQATGDKDSISLNMQQIDAAILPNIAEYLATADKKSSSSLAAMGGGCLPQIMRTFRDLNFTSCGRVPRLLGGIRGQLIKAKTNIQLGGAFI